LIAISYDVGLWRVPDDGYNLPAPVPWVITVNANNPASVLARWPQRNGKARLEQSMSPELRASRWSPQAEHRAAKHDQKSARAQRSAFDIFYHPGSPGLDESLPGRLYKIRVFLPALEMPKNRVRLTRWTCPDEIKSLKRKRQRISLVKLVPAIPRLRFDIYPCDVKPRPLQTLRRAASSTEKIQRSLHFTLA
jgi:hypothetical protein